MHTQRKPETLLLMLAITANLLSSCKTVPLPTASEAGVSFRTRAIELPPELVWSKRSAAHELINVKDLTVVLSGGGNPMPDIKWLKYKPPLPWIKNIERRLLFDGSYFIRSPQAPEGVTGSGRYIVREISGHTWVELAQPVAVDFIPAGRKTDIMKPAPGHLVIKTIMKPQVLRWSGTIYQLADNEGNAYVMHAYEDPAGPTTDVVLPAGWTIRRVELREPLVITPSQGGYYNIVGDCLGQGYHQYAFAGTEYPAH